MKWLDKAATVLRVVVSLFPLIVQLVREIEAAFPQGGQGATKLRMVREALESAFSATVEVVDDAKDAFSAAWPALERVIGRIVALYNDLGEFKKS